MKLRKYDIFDSNSTKENKINLLSQDKEEIINILNNIDLNTLKEFQGQQFEERFIAIDHNKYYWYNRLEVLDYINNFRKNI